MGTSYRKLFEEVCHALFDENTLLKADNRELKLRIVRQDESIEGWASAYKAMQQQNAETAAMLVESGSSLEEARKEIERLQGTRLAAMLAESDARLAEALREIERLQGTELVSMLAESDARLAEALREIERLQGTELASKLAESDARLAEALREIERLRCLGNTDGTNSGLPTGQTPIDKEKVVPNSREKTGKKRGGQAGHAKSTLGKFRDSEVTHRVPHTLETCPRCNTASLFETGRIDRDESEYELVLVKRRHSFAVYTCEHCGKEVRTPIPPGLRAQNQYGPNLQAMALTLMVMGNMPVNKVAEFIAGYTGGEYRPCQAYLMKLMGRFRRGLQGFADDVKAELLRQRKVHWDDTVIRINRKRACLRFYGTDWLALYRAHMHKDKQGLVDDRILKLLPKETVVIHDHNTVNYNEMFSFTNAECNAHLIRDLQKVRACLESKWAERMQDFLKGTNEERKALAKARETGFDAETLAGKLDLFEEIMAEAEEENQASLAAGRSYAKKERTLIKRLRRFSDEYLSWIWDFDIPFTNNLAERGLRGAKGKMNVSGQFWNISRAMDWALLKTYVETCRRNGFDAYHALCMLVSGHPLTLAEVLGHGASAGGKDSQVETQGGSDPEAVQAGSQGGSDPEAVQVESQGGSDPEAVQAETQDPEAVQAETQDPEAVQAGSQGGSDPEAVQVESQGGSDPEAVPTGIQGGHIRKQSKARSLQGAGFG